jgi:hypothetical protein
MEWGDYKTKANANWASPATIDNSISNDIIKKIVENDLKYIKSIYEQNNGVGAMAYYKVVIEVYEHDSDLIAIYFLY